jgi:hypothetical protein
MNSRHIDARMSGVADYACEEVATPGELHHSRVADALVEGACRVGDLLYSLHAEER